MAELYARTFPLDDIEIMRSGDGRTVEAYAAVFDAPAEIRDEHGHYMEEIDRAAFNRTLSHGIDRVNVFYHHGLTLAGTPSELGSVPIGRPLEIRPDGRGLRTVTRYNKSDLADAVLASIRNGDIKGQSFRGGIYNSSPRRVPRRRAGGELPMVRRTELGLREYGPTPTPFYVGAEIIAVRTAVDVAADIAGLDEAERAELLRVLSAGTPQASPVDPAASNQDPGAEDPREELAHSRRLQIARNALRLKARGVLNNG
jgi:HK97 family phage prohead protease